MSEEQLQESTNRLHNMSAVAERHRRLREKYQSKGATSKLLSPAEQDRLTERLAKQQVK